MDSNGGHFLMPILGVIASGIFKVTGLTTDYLVVAGGGGGGASSGGGGGAGGLRSTVTASGGTPGTVETSLILDLNTIYTVTVGAGGAGGPGSTSGIRGKQVLTLYLAL